MNITIPPEALEKGRAAFTDAMLTVPQPDPIEAACRAMLEAWPGMRLGKYRDVAGDNDRIILPLTEKTDAA